MANPKAYPIGMWSNFYAAQNPAYVLPIHADLMREDFIGQPQTLLLDSLLKIIKMGDVGYMCYPQSVCYWGGSYVLGRVGKFVPIEHANIVVRTTDIVIYDKPGVASLCVSNHLGEFLADIIENQ